MNRKFKWILILIGLFFISQGLFKFKLVPISLASMILGTPYSAKPIDFFIYPLLYFIFKFFLAIGGYKDVSQFFQKIYERFLKGNKGFEIPEVKKYGFYGGQVIVFRSFLFDFFIFSLAFCCSFIIAGYLTSIGYIANNEQSMYPIVLNFFLGFTIIFKYFA